MWKLTIEDDEQKQISLPLVQPLYGVGRDEVNEIRLTERNISRKHATLKQNGEGWVVQDLDSYNGTFINGLRVAGEQHVGHGDILQLGDYRLEFSDEGRAAPPQPAATAKPQPLAQHQRPDRLVVVVGPQPGQEFFLDRDHFTMGRSEDANVSVNHSSVSRFHAELFSVGNGRYEIIDKGSANGIRINGQEVRRGFIEAGDALELGDVRLRFVGAGKIFRAGFDRTQVPAVTGYDPTAKKPTSSSSKVLILIGVGALLGIIAVAIVATYVATKDTPTPPTTSAAVSSEVPAADAELLAQAKAKQEAGDLDGAHELIAKIPPDSPVLKDPQVAEIEGAWADILFKRADEPDLEQQKVVELLWKIATTPTVDEARRLKASAKLREVGVEVPEDPKELKPNTPMPTNFKPLPRPSTTTTTKPSGTIDRQALDKPRDKMSELQGRFDSLSQQELMLLAGLCQQEGNMKCAAAAGKRAAELRAQGTSAPSAKKP